ncbi:MAG TPA: PD-(D/E)XK nuclease family protein [Xanthobacteraceae bacterium]|nr:PD-(D/E)XK nuclease family protein [Xanthobacteraceae bacterium]
MATHIYRDLAGNRLPSVTTIISRFKDSGGLIHWAWQLGIDGKDYRQERQKAADAGTIAHQMIEAHIKGEPWKPAEPADADVLAKARAGFAAYLKWAEMSRLVIRHTEVPLCSETHKYGGCLDAIGTLDNQLILIDWKSSNAIYHDYLIQMAAYKALWEENYPGEEHKITGGFHLCRFSKENCDFSHHHYPNLDDAWEAFLLMRRLYDLDKQLKKRAA